MFRRIYHCDDFHLLAIELLPPLSLSLGAVGENSVWVFWTPPEEVPGHLPDGFAVSYTALDGSSRTDFVERGNTEHELRGLSPGRPYNITIVTVKRNLRHNDISRPLTLTARTSKKVYIKYGNLVKHENK